MEQLTEEERNCLTELGFRWREALDAFEDGRMKRSEYEAISNEYKEFYNMLSNKYDK